jgi:excisionase family DNA binding protein
MPKLGRAPKQLGSPDLAYAQILYTFREVALYLRRSEATVRRWHNERPLPMTVLGSTFVIPKSALDLWVLAAPTMLPKGQRDG